jgi:hypothetical protein
VALSGKVKTESKVAQTLAYQTLPLLKYLPHVSMQNHLLLHFGYILEQGGQIGINKSLNYIHLCGISPGNAMRGFPQHGEFPCASRLREGCGEFHGEGSQQGRLSPKSTISSSPCHTVKREFHPHFTVKFTVDLSHCA